MITLTMYDVTGIQDYIFQSNELKENIGASTLVAKMTSDFLYQALETTIGTTLAIISDWKDQEFQMIHDQQLLAEVIYSGGGNALVAYRNPEIAAKVNKKLSKIILEKVGSIPLVFITKEVEGKDFHQDRKKLLKELKEKKNSIGKSTPLLGVSITALDTKTNYPVSMYDEQKKAYVPLEIFYKRKMARDMNKSETEKGYKMPLEFDQLGRGEGESNIAVVHIDGNSLGRLFDCYLKKHSDYVTAISTMRKLSTNISNVYRDAFAKTVDFIIEAIKENKLERLNLQKDHGDVILPIRSIVLNGDDVTFVCDARIAFAVTEYFLHRINEAKILPGEGKNLSACAGIAIVKSHFPFYRAYQIAEICCSNAKEKGKTIANDTSTDVKSWMDFHIVQSGIINDITTYRQQNYNLFDTGSHLEHKKYKAFNLLWRPWLVDTDSDAEQEEARFNFNHFKSIFSQFTEGEKKWPRHRLKQLRDTLVEGKNATESLISELNSRGLQLPKVKMQDAKTFLKEGFNAEYQTPYYDVLEMLDLYIPLEEEQE
jgi:hypothetical protein